MGWLTDLLKDYPALSVAKERLALMEERLKHAEARSSVLQQENESLRAELTELKKRVPSDLGKNPFFEYSGVLWKESRDGLIDPLAYCPVCKLAMSTFPPRSNDSLICTKCNFAAPFAPSEVKDKALKLEVELLSA